MYNADNGHFQNLLETWDTTCVTSMAKQNHVFYLQNYKAKVYILGIKSGKKHLFLVMKWRFLYIGLFDLNSCL